MRIKTQFIVTMVLFAVILVIVAASAIMTNRQVERAGEQERIAAGIAQGAGELGHLSNDYLIYRESQQLARWQSRFAAFSGQVAALRVDTPEQQALVANIRANRDRMKAVFDSTPLAVPERPAGNQSAVPNLAFLQVSWSRMAVQTQALAADAMRLSQLLRQKMDRLTERRTILMYTMVGLFGVFLLISYLFTYRRILKSMAKLQAGAAIIGSGNLDFSVEDGKNDEMGELSRAFNRMTGDLKAVTASKVDLEREIDERRRAEEELRRQREWLRVTLASIGDAVIAADAASRVTFMNAVAETLTGWPLQEASARPVAEVFNIVNEYTRKAVESPVTKVLEEGVIVGLANHTILLRRDGTEVPIDDSGAPIRDAGGKTLGVVLVFRDITERRRAEEAVRRNEAELIEAQGLAHIGNWYWDAKTDATTGSDELLRIYGLDPETQTMPAFREQRGRLYPVESWERVNEAVERTLETGIGYELDVEAIRDGKAIWITTRGEVARDAHGRIVGLRGTVQDITERKWVERIQAEHAARLDEINKELESFSYSVSHDLRAPLRAITGYSQMILKRQGEQFDEETRRRFQLILDNAGMMGRLIEDLLAFSRLGRQAVAKRSLDMADLIGEVWEELLAITPCREMALKTGPMPAALGDRTLIRQVYGNLLGNAVKFTQSREAAVIEAGSYVKDSEVVYYIRDNGVGFDMQFYDKLFGVFQRLHTDEEYKGTGIGLALVQRIVHRHGGRVWAEGKVGEGATFFFTLPRIEAGSISEEK